MLTIIVIYFKGEWERDWAWWGGRGLCATKTWRHQLPGLAQLLSRRKSWKHATLPTSSAIYSPSWAWLAVSGLSSVWREWGSTRSELPQTIWGDHEGDQAAGWRVQPWAGRWHSAQQHSPQQNSPISSPPFCSVGKSLSFLLPWFSNMWNNSSKSIGLV